MPLPLLAPPCPHTAFIDDPWFPRTKVCLYCGEPRIRLELVPPEVIVPPPAHPPLRWCGPERRRGERRQERAS